MRVKIGDDPLIRVIEDIRAHAQKLDLVVFFGDLMGEEKAEVHWNEEHGGNWERFLETAKALDTKLVYLNWDSFEELDVQEALQKLGETALKASEAGRIFEGEPRKREIEKYRNKVGLIVMIELVFLFGDTLHIYQRSPDWFDAFEGLIPKEDEDEEGRAPVQEADRTVVDKWASMLASDPQFGKCKAYNEREYLLEKLTKAEFAALPVPRVIGRAETIYQFDVRPKEDERLLAEARRLRTEGKNMAAIAQKLGISRERVSGLLAE